MSEIEDPSLIRRIVVGVDGSVGSDKALEWSIAEANRSPATLELVTAWMFPMALGYVFAKTPDKERQEVQRIADRAACHVTEVAPEIVVRSILSEAEAGPALVKLSAGADLLVVGARGLGALRELLLGSVGAYCARHAPCPVVIVR